MGSAASRLLGREAGRDDAEDAGAQDVPQSDASRPLVERDKGLVQAVPGGSPSSASLHDPIPPVSQADDALAEAADDNVSTHSESMDIDEETPAAPIALAADLSDREEGEISEDDPMQGVAPTPGGRATPPPPTTHPITAPFSSDLPHPTRHIPQHQPAAPPVHPYGALPPPRPVNAPPAGPAPVRPPQVGTHGRRGKGYLDRDGQAAKAGHRYGMGTLPYQPGAADGASLDYGGEAIAGPSQVLPAPPFIPGFPEAQVPAITPSGSSSSLSAQAAAFQPRLADTIVGLSASPVPPAQPAPAIDRKQLLLERLQAERHKAAVSHAVQHQAAGHLNEEGLRELVNSVRHLLQLRVSPPEIVALGVPQGLVEHVASTLAPAPTSFPAPRPRSLSDALGADASTSTNATPSPLSKNKAKKLRRAARLAAEADARLGAQLQTAAALQAMVANSASVEVMAEPAASGPSQVLGAQAAQLDRPSPLVPPAAIASADTAPTPAGPAADAVANVVDPSILALKNKLLLQQKLKRRLQEMQARKAASNSTAAESSTQPVAPNVAADVLSDAVSVAHSPGPSTPITVPATLVEPPIRIDSPPPAPIGPPKRGVKRPNAIELAEQGPSHLSGSAFFSDTKRRKPWAPLAPPVPKRMVIELTSDSEDDGDEPAAAASSSSGARQDEDLRQQLAEMMRNLEEHKAKIAARESRRLARLASLAASEGTTPGLSPSPAPSHATPIAAPAAVVPAPSAAPVEVPADAEPDRNKDQSAAPSNVARPESEGDQEMDIDESSSDEKPMDVLDEGDYGREAVVTLDHAEPRPSSSAVRPVQLEDQYKPMTFLSRTIPYTLLALRSNADLPTSQAKTKPPKKLNRFPLIYITLGRISKTSRNIRLCRYEIEGGACSDAHCDGLHPSRDLVPDNQDLTTLLQMCIPPGQQEKYIGWVAELVELKDDKTSPKGRVALDRRRQDVETFLSAVDASLS